MEDFVVGRLAGLVFRELVVRDIPQLVRAECQLATLVTVEAFGVRWSNALSTLLILVPRESRQGREILYLYRLRDLFFSQNLQSEHLLLQVFLLLVLHLAISHQLLLASTSLLRLL